MEPLQSNRRTFSSGRCGYCWCFCEEGLFDILSNLVVPGSYTCKKCQHTVNLHLPPTIPSTFNRQSRLESQRETLPREIDQPVPDREAIRRRGIFDGGASLSAPGTTKNDGQSQLGLGEESWEVISKSTDGLTGVDYISGFMGKRDKPDPATGTIKSNGESQSAKPLQTEAVPGTTENDGELQLGLRKESWVVVSKNTDGLTGADYIDGFMGKRDKPDPAIGTMKNNGESQLANPLQTEAVPGKTNQCRQSLMGACLYRSPVHGPCPCEMGIFNIDLTNPKDVGRCRNCPHTSDYHESVLSASYARACRKGLPDRAR
jgi:hypothetical protein